MKIKRILCALVFGAVACAAHAQQVPVSHQGLDPATLTEVQIGQTQAPQALMRLVSLYKKNGDLERLGWTLRRLTVLQPNNGDMKIALATTYALQGEKSKTYDTLLSMQKQGFGYDLANDKNFAKVADTKVWTYAVDNLKSNLRPFGEGKVAFSLPKGDYLFESLAFDPKRQQFLAGSVREGKVYLVGKNGQLQDFITPNAENGLWSVYAMAADPTNDALYVASTASVYYKNFSKEDFGKAGVFKFSLSSGKLVEKYLLPAESQPRTLSSIAVGSSGVFVADGVRNIIYRLDGKQFKPIVSNPMLTSLRGLAISGDGKTLYFADYVQGVLGVDLVAGKGFDLAYNPAMLVLGGVDGLYWYDGTLVVIENGMSPRRVMRLKLDPAGRKVMNAMPLDVGNPVFSLPTYGAIDGDGLYFVANSQKNAYGSFGTPKDDAELEPIQVFRSDLRFAWKDAGVAKPGTMAQTPDAAVKPQGGLFGNVEAGAQSVPAH